MRGAVTEPMGEPDPDMRSRVRVESRLSSGWAIGLWRVVAARGEEQNPTFSRLRKSRSRSSRGSSLARVRRRSQVQARGPAAELSGGTRRGGGVRKRWACVSRAMARRRLAPADRRRPAQTAL